MTLDLALLGGTIVDGTSAKSFAADIGVENGAIVEIGKIPRGAAKRAIDVLGLTVSPGFIDIHSHSDYTLLVDPRASSSIHQGVTFELIGNCGWGCAPVRDPALAQTVIYGFNDTVPLTWRSMGGYLERLEAAGPAVNVAALVPNGQLRLAALSAADRPASGPELATMKRLLAEGLEEGAFGYSTGLEYANEVCASEVEVTELCRVVGKAGGFYATHTRNRDERAVEAVAEAIRTAENAGVRLQISHLTPRGGIGDVERCIDLVDKAKRRGQPIAFDMHTRFFGTTNLRSLLPSWAFAGGRDALARRLADPGERAKMKEFRSLLTALGDWDRIVLLDNPRFADWSRRSFGEIGRMNGRDPHECALDLLLSEIDHLYRPMVILHCYDEDMLRLTYRHADCMIGSDATALAPDGPLSGTTFHGAYTWAAWFYRRMVRETKTFTPEEAIHKITGLPAQVLGLARRGRLAIGAQADVVAFDGAAFSETGTTFEPNRLATGMHTVVVNGVVTMADGVLSGARGGKVLRSSKE